MHIKSITLENFLCYYDKKEFLLSPKLNLILGDNGTGKTKFFEAIYWLLNGCEHSQLLNKASAKALHSCETGKNVRVAVSVEAEQWGKIKFVERAFTVRKDEDGQLIVGSAELKSILEDETGRRRVDGTETLKELFPTSIRKYLLFKGESELNIFDNPNALNILIQTFSHGKHYPKYSALGDYLVKKAQREVDKDHSLRGKDAKEVSQIDADIRLITSEIQRDSERLQALTENRDRLKTVVETNEKYVHNAERLGTYDAKINDLEKNISKVRGRISEEYTTYLFDKKWILANFDCYQEAFIEKVKQLDKVRRAEKREFDKQLIEKKTKEKVAKKVADIALGILPLDLPGASYVEEMLEASCCSVCNTPAPPGSDARQYIEERLRLFRTKNEEKQDEEEDEQLYENDYMQELLYLRNKQERSGSLNRSIQAGIKNHLEFNKERKEEVVHLTEKLEKEEQNRNEVLSSSSVAKQKLHDVAASISENMRRLQSDEKGIDNLKLLLNDREGKLRELEKRKDDLARKTVDRFLMTTRDILQQVNTIFHDTHERLYDEFVEKLRSRSNIIFQQINVNVFTGKIVFDVVKENYTNPRIRIKLVDKNSNTFSANQSLNTTMYMAVLFAIADLAQESAQESYPMFFDAPTSSFGEAKTKEFLNIVSDTDQQRIVIFYNFVGQDESGRSFVKEDFKEVKRGKGYLLQLARPFDEHKLETINTLVEEI